MTTGTHYVYIVFGSGGQVLYVGATHAPTTRRHQHRTTSPFRQDITAFVCEGPMPHSSALLREDDLIWTLSPVYNKPQACDYLDFGLCEDGSTPPPAYDPTAEPLPCAGYGIARAARLCGLSRRALTLAIEAGELPVHRRHGRGVVLRDDLAAWIHRLPTHIAA